MPQQTFLSFRPQCDKAHENILHTASQKSIGIGIVYYSKLNFLFFLLLLDWQNCFPFWRGVGIAFVF